MECKVINISAKANSLNNCELLVLYLEQSVCTLWDKIGYREGEIKIGGRVIYTLPIHLGE